ncbi:SusE domain-containing protein [Massilibacteroides sp.]|uniref:SusE domain-containing protein n=1 Tax=Massilibacteroides sp. TaxID=2034766 RepID=UPI00262C893B|nr:SusE domain-containing protein [Massilibacteroides sp.]MDD4515523.1 SusE domain-containing protein [Massilibacteroides sp.]
MKKGLFTLLLAGLAIFAACSDDIDSNPTIQQPSTFELNMPALGGNVYDLENTDSIRLTYKQPEYGYTAPVTYYAQLSVSGTWNEATSVELDDATYVELDGSVTVCEFGAAADLVNKAVMKLGNFTDEGQLPADGMPLYIRMKAALAAGYECYSNVIELSIDPYYIALVAADPELWYLIGGCIGDGSWGSEIGTGVIPLSPVEGAKYDDVTGKGDLTYIGYFPSDKGFKIVRVPGEWDDQWGADGGDFNKPRLKDADGEGSDFFVPVSGYYKISLNTKENVLSIVATDEPRNVYDKLFISGDFNGWGEETTMSPVNTVEGVINHIWKYELDATGGDTTAKFLYSGWTPNWGADTFPYGFGVNGGANVPVTAGSYVVILNDIDGYYHFFSK